MKTTTKLLCLTVLFILAVGSLHAAASARIDQVVGKVSVRNSEAAPWVNATVGMTLAAGASITTGYQSAIVLSIAPTGSVVRLNQFTTISVSSLGMSSGGEVDTKLDLKMGTVRAVVKNTAEARSRFEVSTPVATASVRGTIPEVSHSPDTGTRIVYIEGSGTVVSSKGRTQILARNQSSKVNQQGQATTPIQESNKDRAVGSVDWNLSTGDENVLMSDNTSLITLGGGGSDAREILKELNEQGDTREDNQADLEKLRR